MTKIAIVGPELSKWLHFVNPKIEVQAQAYRIFKENAKVTKSFDHGSCIEDYDFSDIILVSGHCPKGGVDIWVEELADQLGIKKEIYPAEANQWSDYEDCAKNEIGVDDVILRKGYRSRNIEIAEACDVLYCIVPFRDYPLASHCGIEAEMSDFYKDAKCRHCDRWGHPTNGGCWTMKYAKKLGKEVHLVVIE